MSTPLAERLDRLFRLQDLDIMIAETEDPEQKRTEEKMGFRIEATEKLRAARQRMVEKIEPRDLRAYERIAKRYHHAIVPVEERTCLGCYMALPTSSVSLRAEPEQLLTCENCGRILYWLE